MTDRILPRPIGVAIPAKGSNIRVVATGLLGEQIAVTRAEQRELRRLLDEVQQDRRAQ